MIYGANGYTGRLIAEAAVARGEFPVLAGRNREAVRSLAEQLGCPWTAFAPPDASDGLLAVPNLRTVVNCAGPFSQTAFQLASACVLAAVHYLDVSGEVLVLQRVFSLHERAKRAGCVVMPGVGYAHSDCLAVSVAESVGQATSLTLAFRGFGRASRGTARTAVEDLAQGGFLVRNSRLIPACEAQVRQAIPFASGTRHAASVTWGDLAIALRSTASSEITVFTEMPRTVAWLSPLLGLTKALLRWRWVRRGVERAVDRYASGPEPQERMRGAMEYWASATSATGQTVRRTMTTPNIYTLTADIVLEAVGRLASGTTLAGAVTPASAFGVDFLSALPGIVLSPLHTAEAAQ